LTHYGNAGNDCQPSAVLQMSNAGFQMPLLRAKRILFRWILRGRLKSCPPEKSKTVVNQCGSGQISAEAVGYFSLSLGCSETRRASEVWIFSAEQTGTGETPQTENGRSQVRNFRNFSNCKVKSLRE